MGLNLISLITLILQSLNYPNLPGAPCGRDLAGVLCPPNPPERSARRGICLLTEGYIAPLSGLTHSGNRTSNKRSEIPSEPQANLGTSNIKPSSTCPGAPCGRDLAGVLCPPNPPERSARRGIYRLTEGYIAPLSGLTHSGNRTSNKRSEIPSEPQANLGTSNIKQSSTCPGALCGRDLAGVLCPLPPCPPRFSLCELCG